jgi:CheY-like chemotaxis protein
MILDEHLPGIGGIEVCGLLRDDPTFDPATPIIITGSSPASRAVKTAAFAAGAWEFCTQPLDTDTLLLELTTFIRAKRASTIARSHSLVDETTGVMTPLGLERWAEQLAARASRNHEPLACVVLMPTTSSATTSSSFVPGADNLSAKVAEFLQLSRAHFRRSDIVGRIADGRLALLAPDTDDAGVHGLLARLRAAIAATGDIKSNAAGSDFRAGYWAVRDFASTPLEPAELLRRASRALDHVNLSPGDNLAIGFDQLPLS